MIYNSVGKTTIYRVKYLSKIFDVYVDAAGLDIAYVDTDNAFNNPAYVATAQELFEKVVTRYQKNGLRTALTKVNAKVIKSYKAQEAK